MSFLTIPNTDVPDFFSLLFFSFLKIELFFQTIPTVDRIVKREYSNQLPKTVETGQKIDSLAKSLASKGCVPIEESVQTSNQAIMGKKCCLRLVYSSTQTHTKDDSLIE